MHINEMAAYVEEIEGRFCRLLSDARDRLDSLERAHAMLREAVADLESALGSLRAPHTPDNDAPLPPRH